MRKGAPCRIRNLRKYYGDICGRQKAKLSHVRRALERLVEDLAHCKRNADDRSCEQRLETRILYKQKEIEALEEAIQVSSKRLIAAQKADAEKALGDAMLDLEHKFCDIGNGEIAW